MNIVVFVSLYNYDCGMTDLAQEQKQKKFEVDGVVEECLPDTIFRVNLDLHEGNHAVIAHLSGKMRLHYIKIMKGDKVKVEISPYDLDKGRIIYRYNT